jgi:superfamily II DNA or RNA helicase
LAKITLRLPQKEAIQKGLAVVNSLFCMRVGGGKTFASMFLSRYLLNNKKIDKVIFCITLSGVGVFKNEFNNVGIDVKLASCINDILEFLKGKEKFLLIKHSLIEELGINQVNIDLIENYLKKDYKKIMLIIDEAHKFSNHESIGNFAVDNTRRFYEKIVLLTATPYSSKLDQIFGLVKLIYPKKWRNLKEFRDNFVKSEIIKDWRTGKFLRTEDVEYINLPTLRKELEEFTYFYFPPIPLTYKEHKASLKPEKFEEYKKMCQEIYKELKDRASGKNKKDEDED